MAYFHCRKLRDDTMNWRNIVSLSAFAALLISFAATNAGTARAATRGPDFEWTVVAMDFDGSWGVGTGISTNQAIPIAIANCKKMSQRNEIGCGALLRTMRSGWILALRCGSESILVADTTLKKAANLAIAREVELRHHYVRDMPPCKLVISVDPHGVVTSEKLRASR
jgi:hypothetical protein